MHRIVVLLKKIFLETFVKQLPVSDINGCHNSEPARQSEAESAWESTPESGLSYPHDFIQFIYSHVGIVMTILCSLILAVVIRLLVRRGEP